MKRSPHLTELMDDPQADPQRLYNTYQQFSLVNRLLSGWSRIYRRHLRSSSVNTCTTLLDIGAGGADICGHLITLANNEQRTLHATAIDPDPRAAAFFSQQPKDPSITYECITHKSLNDRGVTFDFVVSNHLLHHLTPDAIRQLCKDAEQLATRKVIFNDIHRSTVAYLLFSCVAPIFFRNSFVFKDGARSIRRAFTPNELREIVPGNWQVAPLFPFRLLLIYEH